MLSLGEIAESLGLEVRGDPALSLSGIAPVEVATAEQLSFVAQAKYLGALETTAAGALILKPEWAAGWEGPCLLSDDPYLTYAYATRLFDNRPQLPAGVHPSAHVDPSVELGAGVAVGPNAVIAAGAVIGAGAVVSAGVVIGESTLIGAGTVLHPGVVLYHGVRIGEACVVHANSVIGSDGFGFAPVDGRWEKILQLGGVRIGDRCEIGAGVTIDRGAMYDTVIADDVIMDNQVHLAHGVQVGAGTAMAACVAVAGSTRIGERCQFAGQAGLADHINIADDVHVAGQGRVSGSLTEPGHYVSGTPVQPFAEWRRNAVRFTQLDQLARKVRELEKAVAAATGDDKPNEESTP